MKGLARFDLRGVVFLSVSLAVSAGLFPAPGVHGQSAQPNQVNQGTNQAGASANQGAANGNGAAACTQNAESKGDAVDTASSKVSSGAKAVSNLGTLFGKKKTSDDANKVANEAGGCGPNGTGSAAGTAGAAGAKGGANAPAKPNGLTKSNSTEDLNTDKMASAAGFVDVVGIKLGMAPSDAVGALKSDNQGFTDSNIVVNYLPSKADYQQGNRSSGSITSITASVANPQVGNEQVSIDFSYPPSAGFVVSVARTMTFAAGQQPLADNLIAGLRKKYGQETFGATPKGAAVAQSLMWFFDAQGKLINAGQLPNQSQTACAATVQEPPRGQDLEDELNTLAANPQLPQQIQQYSAGTNDPCKDYTVVVATTGPQTGAGLATSLQVKVTSHPLIRSSWAGLLTYAQQSARAQAAQATPKL